jgi:uncharacterized protein with HEPN domain
MLEHARAATSIVGTLDPVGLAADTTKYLAAQKALEVIGEAANQVAPGQREELSAIPWRKIIDMRNYLIHAYRTVRPEIVVGTVRNDLPLLISILIDVLAAEAP